VQVICAALKRYGMFVADNGSDWFVTASTMHAGTTTRSAI